MIWIILLLGLILRLINLNQSLWLDEATQGFLSKKSLYSIWFERIGDFHPPLSYILYHFWIQFGTSEIWLRLLPVIFGVATVFTVYKLVEKLFNKEHALFSALLLATAPYHIYYSQEIRMYSMATFFAVVSMFYFISAKSLGYVFSTVALIYTHYMGGFLIIAQIGYLFVYKRNEILRYSKLLILSLLLYIPWLPLFWDQLMGGINANIYLPGWSDLLGIPFYKAVPLTFLKFSIGRIDFENIYNYGLIAFIVLGFFSYLIINSFRSKLDIKLVAWWLFLPIILTWFISLLIPLNQPFRLLFALPAFYILLAIGIDTLRSRERSWRLAVGGVLLVNFLSVGIYFINPKFQREDWRGAVNFINQENGNRSGVVFAWPQPFPPYEWYKGKEGIGVVKNFPAKKDEIKTNMDRLSGKSDLYFFEYLQALSDPNKFIQGFFLDNSYTIKNTFNFQGVGFVHHFQLQ